MSNFGQMHGTDVQMTLSKQITADGSVEKVKDLDLTNKLLGKSWDKEKLSSDGGPNG